MSISEYYSTFWGLIDELTQYHPVTINVEVIKKQRKEFYVFKFLSRLHPNLQFVKPIFYLDMIAYPH